MAEGHSGNRLIKDPTPVCRSKPSGYHKRTFIAGARQSGLANLEELLRLWSSVHPKP